MLFCFLCEEGPAELYDQVNEVARVCCELSELSTTVLLEASSSQDANLRDQVKRTTKDARLLSLQGHGRNAKADVRASHKGEKMTRQRRESSHKSLSVDEQQQKMQKARC